MRNVFPEIGNEHLIEDISLGDLKLDHLCLSVGKGIDLKGCRKIEDAGHFSGGFEFRVDDHGQTEFVAQITGFLTVIRGAYTCDRGTGMELCGDGAAKEIQFVRTGNGDQKVCVFDTGLLKCTVAGAAALDGDDIELGIQIRDDRRIFFDNGDVIAFLAQLFSECMTDFAVADNDDLQTLISRLR